jgi:hypothetical protein
MNGMVFAGCSFTWGQGLYYYSKMSTIKRPPPEQFVYSCLTDAHNHYMFANRFPRLVAQHFETFEVVRKSNGGSERQNLVFLDSLFSKNGVVYNKHDHPYRGQQFDGIFDYSEISYIILQTSVIQRNQLFVDYKGEKCEIRLYDDKKESLEILYHFMEINNLKSFSEFLKYYSDLIMNEVKEAFQFYESKGIKCLLLCWQDQYLNTIYNDSYLNEKLITLDYLGKNYKCIDHMIKSNDNLFIKDDHAFFGDDCPQDSHPSKLCHKVIAENIIKKIETL